jgi:hypothetical protein
MNCAVLVLRSFGILSNRVSLLLLLVHEQVCVPQHMAVVLTYPERVTTHNVEKLKQRVLNGGPPVCMQQVLIWQAHAEGGLDNATGACMQQ